MSSCKFCNQDGLEWFQENDEKWKLGIKLDINNFRKHICITQEKTGNKWNWVKFSCIKCGNPTRQNIKLLISKTINICYECGNHAKYILEEPTKK